MNLPEEVVDLDLPGLFAVVGDVVAERVSQVAAHSYGQAHDDRHTTAEWGWLLGRRASDLACPWPSATLDARRQLVEVAAIAIAAVQALDRRAQPGSGRRCLYVEADKHPLRPGLWRCTEGLDHDGGHRMAPARDA